MSASKYTTPAIAAAAVIGAGIYMSRGRRGTHDPAQDPAARRREHADAKRDIIGSGAGVGNNKMTLGPEVGAGINYTDNPQRDAPRPDTSRDNLPSGGVPTGYGGGNSNARTVEMGPSGSGSTGVFSGLFGTSKTAQSSTAGSGVSPHTAGQGLGQTLHGLAGTGGSSSRDQGNSELDPKNTKIMSNKADTPTKRGGSPFDKHRKDVTAVEPTTEYPGKE